MTTKLRKEEKKSASSRKFKDAGRQLEKREEESLVDVEDAALTGPDWNANVYLAVGGSTGACRVAEQIARELQVGKRPRVKALSASDLHVEVDLFRKQKSHDAGYKTTLYREAVSCFSENGRINDKIMAKLIKLRLLVLKDESINWRNTELSKGVQADEQSTDTAASSVSSTNANKRTRDRSTTKSRADTKERHQDTLKVTGRKKNTDPLHARTDPDKIVDWPGRGPQLYVILFGFYDSQLPQSMVRVGIPLRAIIKVSSAPQLKYELHTEHVRKSEIAEKNTAAKKQEIRGTMQKPKAKKAANSQVIELPSPSSDTISEFWSDFLQMLDKEDASLLFKDVALTEFSAREGSDTSLQESNFRDFINLIYELEYFRQYHVVYLSNIRVCTVEAIERSTDIQSMTIYNNDISLMPVENVTVPFIIHCMLNQIESLCSENNDIADESFRSLNENVCEIKTVDLTPTIILQGDCLQKNMFHHPEKANNFYQNTLSILKNLPIMRLWEQYKPLEELEREIYDFHIDRLHYCSGREEITKTFLCHYLHTAFFTKLRGAVSKQKQLKTNPHRSKCLFRRRHFPIALTHVKEILSEVIQHEEIPSEDGKNNDSNNRIAEIEGLRRMFDCLDISSLLECLGTSTLNMASENSMEKYTYIEKMESNIMIQTICKAWEMHCCMTYHYFKPSDVLLLHFFQGISTKHWRANLITPVGFRDFHDFVLHKEWAWLRDEAQRYWEGSMMDKSTLTKASSHDYPQLLADWQMFCEIRGMDKYDEKNDFNTMLKEEPLDLLSQKILAYDVVPLRVEVGGNTAEFASPDGTKVYSELRSWVRGNVSLSTRISMSDHMLTFNTRPPVDKHSEKMLCHVISSMGVIVAFYADIYSLPKQQLKNNSNKNRSYQVGGATANAEKSQKRNNKNNSQKEKGENVNNNKTGNEVQNHQFNEKSLPKINNFKLCKFKTDVSISCPSGLHVNSLSCGESNSTHYIKQFYLQGSMQEKHRCVLGDGRVLKFFLDESIEILCPDGTICLCERFTRLQDHQILVTKTDKEKPGANSDEVNASETVRKDNMHPVKDNSALHSKDIKLWHVSDAVLTTIWGERYRIQNDVVKDRSYIPVKRAVDDYLGEIFIRRFDGTNSFLKSNGELIVTFPDGTRISSSWAVETELVFCEWTNEEMSRYNIKFNAGTAADFDKHPNNSNETNSLSGNAGHQFDSDEGFVSIIMMMTAEHPNYATVSFNGGNGDCILRLPGNVGVILYTDGNMSLELGNNTTLVTSHNSLVFSSHPCQNCNALSQTVISPLHPVSVEREDIYDFCTTRDILGNTFTVRSDGSCLLQGAELGAHAEDCPHRTLQQNRKCFVLRRDFSGEEILHEQDVENCLRKVKRTEGGSVHQYKVPGRPPVVVFNTFTPHTRTKWAVPYAIPRHLPQRLSWLDLQLLPLGLPPEWFHFKLRPPTELRPSSIQPEDDSCCMDSRPFLDHRSTARLQDVASSHQFPREHRPSPAQSEDDIRLLDPHPLPEQRSSEKKQDAPLLEQSPPESMQGVASSQHFPRKPRPSSAYYKDDRSWPLSEWKPSKSMQSWASSRHSPRRPHPSPTLSEDDSSCMDLHPSSELRPSLKMQGVSTTYTPPKEPRLIPAHCDSDVKQQLIAQSFLKMQQTGGNMFDFLWSALVRYKSTANAIVEQYSSYPREQVPAEQEKLQAYLLELAVGHSKTGQIL